MHGTVEKALAWVKSWQLLAVLGYHHAQYKACLAKSLQETAGNMHATLPDLQHFLPIQVVGLERIAIVVPAEAITQFQSALGTAQDQHASGVVSTARVQQQLPPTHPQITPTTIASVPSSASAPCTPSVIDVSPQVKPHHPPLQPPGCGVQPLEHMPPIMFQPMWLLPPPAGAYALCPCASSLCKQYDTLSGICYVTLPLNNMFHTLQCAHSANTVLCKVLDATFCTHITSV